MIAPVPKPVIIDCDPGTDDALALWLALASPEQLDVRLVGVVGGNVPLALTLANARAVVGLAGRGGDGDGGRAVPVHGGADRPLLGRFTSETRVHGTAGLGGAVLPEGPPAAPGHAVDAMRAVLAAAEAPVTLVGLGPATNLALLLSLAPELRDRIACIVLMTGAWGEGNATPSAEFNAWSDPEALSVVLAAGVPVVLAMLDLTEQAVVTPARIAALRALGGGQAAGARRCLRAACDVLEGVGTSRRVGHAGALLHDPCTIAWLLRPDLFTSRAVSAEVALAGPCRGRTVIDRWNPAGTVTLLETLDADGFFALLAERLVRLP